MKLAVVGAGWAGMACALEAVRGGHQVTLFDAARSAGGRARRVDHVHGMALDNGQHILIGAYRETLGLLREVGVDLDAALLRLPLSLRFADGGGLQVPARLPPPLDLLAGIAGAHGWTWRDKAGLVGAALRWRRMHFDCDASLTVAALCRDLSPRVQQELIEPLCVSALNTPAAAASAQVFLRVLHDALFSERGGADLLLPRVDLGALLPDPALRWLGQRGAELRIGTRVHAIAASADGWMVDGEGFDAAVLACAPWDAARLVREAALPNTPLQVQAQDWLRRTEALRYIGIATVYARATPKRSDASAPSNTSRTPAATLTAPMLALRSGAGAPAQFVFDRGQLGGPAGLLAFVVSASDLPRDALQQGVLAQARAQLELHALEPLQTVVEKRATFACTPGLERPPMQIAPGLQACGDYVDGPYPATLEGAVRSGLAAAKNLST